MSMGVASRPAPPHSQPPPSSTRLETALEAMSSSSSSSSMFARMLRTTGFQGGDKWDRAHGRRVMLLLAATTTLYGTWVFFTLGRLLDPDNEDDEMDDEDGELSSGALHAAVILFRIWALCTTIVAGLAVRGLLQPHLPSLRLFAVHSIIDTSITAIVSLVFILTLFSSSLSSKLSHSICSHLARSSSSALESVGLVFSPGTGLENCEEKWSFSIVPLLLLAAASVLFVRTKMTAYVWHYYQEAAFSEGRISLESPSQDSLSSASSATITQHPPHRRYSSSSGSSSSSNNANPSSGHHHRQHHHQHHHHPQHHHDRKESASVSSGTHHPPPKLRLNSGNLPLPGRHSRSSSSASTIRPGAFYASGGGGGESTSPTSPSRIMLLPADYEGQPAFTSPTSFSPSTPQQQQHGVVHTSPRMPSYCHPNSSAESFETVTHHSGSLGSSRKRAMSSGDSPSSHVVVYAPILMSIEEAQQLGGREAVLAASSPPTAATCPTSTCTSTSASTTTAKGNATNPRHRNTSPPVRNVPGHPSSVQPSVPPKTYSEDVKSSAPFQSIKGSRQSLDSDPLSVDKSL